MAVKAETFWSELIARIAPGLRTDDPATTSFLQWAATVQKSVAGRWRVVASSGIGCAMRKDNGALPIACDHPAVGACGFCRKPVCLPHAVVAMNGDVGCPACMQEFAAILRARGGPQAAPPPPRPRAAEAPPPSDAAERKKHLRVLGLKDPASWDEVKTQFRELAKKHHPDRSAHGKRAQAERKMKELSEAYHWLDAHRKAEAA
jgi:hypothetical protein